MTVVRPNSISGINSITVATGAALNIHDADGNVINTITGASGVATYRGIHVGAGTTTSDQGISVGTGASIVSDAVNQLSVYTNNTERVQVRSDGKSVISETGTLTPLSLLTLRGTAGCEITLVGASANDQGVYFNDGSNSGAVIYDHNTNKMSFRANDNKNVTIDSLGSLSVGSGGTIFQNGNIAAAGIVTANGGVNVTGNVSASNDIEIPNDSGKIKLGTGSDLKVYHDGSHNYLEGTSHEIRIRSDDIRFRNASNNKTMLYAHDDGQVELYYDNVLKFYTTTAGARIENADEGDAELRILGGSTNRTAILTLTADNGAGNEDNFRVQVTSDQNWEIVSKPSGNWTTKFRMDYSGNLYGTDTSIGSLSDSRLKKNVADFTYDLDKFKQYKPKTFEWINTSKSQHPDGTQRGFLAQDIESIDASYVSEYILNKEQTEDIALVDESTRMAKAAKLGTTDSMYISVIQQLITKIETLETKVAALESA